MKKDVLTPDVLPKIDMGATKQVGSDRYPYTIVEVEKNGKTIHVQEDEAKPAKGFDYYTNQKYDFTPNKKAPIEIYTRRSNGYFHKLGESTKSSPMFIGKRDKYSDPSF